MQNKNKRRACSKSGLGAVICKNQPFDKTVNATEMFEILF